MPLVSQLKQSAPGAAALTDIYTVPAATQFTGRVLGSNSSAVATTVRVSIAPAGAADAPSQYIAFDVPITGNGPYKSPVFACKPTDVVRVYNTLATVAFTLTGLEKS